MATTHAAAYTSSGRDTGHAWCGASDGPVSTDWNQVDCTNCTHLHAGDDEPTANPATALLDAARTLAAYDPAGPAELADLLRALNDLTGESVLGLLTDALDRWAEHVTAQAWTNGEAIADNLLGASERIFFVTQFLDKARADTGHWNSEENER